MMKILVTGSEGYIGSVLTEKLMARGHQVQGLDTGYYSEVCLYPVGQLSRLLRKDVREVVTNDLEGFDAVVHLAELSNDPLGQHNPETTYEINHLGSVGLARKCKEAGVRRFVYSSSCSVYGAGSDELKTEESTTAPQTAYAHCKLLVERDVSALADSRFCPTFLRNATAYGPSPRIRFDLVLNNLAGLAWTAGEIRMTSDGSPLRPLVHVEDISEAFCCVLEAPEDVIHCQVFNVGDNRQNYRVREIADIVGGVFTGCNVTFGQNNGDKRSYRVCFDKINSSLPGFRCRLDARQGAAQLLLVFRQLKMSREVFEFRTFTRLKQLEYLLGLSQIDSHFLWKNRSPEPTAGEGLSVLFAATAAARGSL